MNVGLAGFRVDVEADVHGAIVVESSVDLRPQSDGFGFRFCTPNEEGLSGVRLRIPDKSG
jgi:hypothetical protein